MQLETYRDHTISLDDRNHKFTVEFEEGKPLHFESYEEARKRIDEVLQASAKSRKLTLPVWVVNGHHWPKTAERGVISGVNLHTNNVTGIKNISDYPNLYPVLPWIVGYVTKINELHEEIEVLEDALSTVVINRERHAVGRNWGGITAEDYAGVLDALEAEHADKTILAEKYAESIKGVIDEIAAAIDGD